MLIFFKVSGILLSYTRADASGPLPGYTAISACKGTPTLGLTLLRSAVDYALARHKAEYAMQVGLLQ